MFNGWILLGQNSLTVFSLHNVSLIDLIDCFENEHTQGNYKLYIPKVTIHPSFLKNTGRQPLEAVYLTICTHHENIMYIQSSSNEKKNNNKKLLSYSHYN